MVLLSLAAWATPVDEVPNPRDLNRWITDAADVIDAATEAELEARLEALHRDLDAEVTVVTLASVAPATPKQFATGLFDHWHIGDAAANNGLLVLLVLDERRLEMETGYGIESTLPDAWLGSMQREQMVPAFKRGAYGEGLAAGVKAVDARLRLDPETVQEGTRGAVYTGSSDAAGGPSIATVTTVGAGGALGTVGLVGGVGLVRARRRRERTCPTCAILMPLLDEATDDAHLSPGQQTEEAVGSVDWQVHQCPQCSFVRSFRVGRWFSGYSSCPSCANQTRRTSHVTLQRATQYSGGLEEITETCAHCSYHRQYTRSTPRLPPPSTSSSSGSSFGGGSSSSGSSGGSSFGGGSSGGGGAGSSW